MKEKAFVVIGMNSYARAIRSVTFLSSNANLLSTGDLSDVTVKCGGQIWKLHRSIICPRCPFFEKAFCGNFQEGNTDILELPEIEPNRFKHIVDYLYSGDCKWHEISAESGNIYVSCSELSVVADYFGLSSLILDISIYMRESFKPIVEQIQQSFETWNNQITDFPTELLKSYIEGVKVAFSTDTYAPHLDPIREAFIHFVADTHYIILYNETFHKEIAQVPELGLKLLHSLFTEGSSFLRLARVGLPYSCDVCKKARKVYTETWLHSSVLNGRCSSC
ncbi:BTB/POZ protein [Xylariales sp. PMI_506]|nr:BTB/POZ protein [Xylariales sp. PMI_506]